MKKGSVWITAGLLLIAAALAIVAYNVWDSRRADKRAREALDKLEPLVAETVPMPDLTQVEDITEVEYPDYVLNPNMEMPVRNVDGYDYIGVLRIPVLELELPVMDDWDYSRLKEAPCRYEGSAYLNDLVIAAHNYEWHFGKIRDLSMGDTVVFTDMDGNEFVYSVLEIETLTPYSVEQMTTGDWDLTLFTCTVGGQSRVTVRCEKIKTS